MKQRFAADGVPIPWFCLIESAEHLHELVVTQGLPLVIKPVDSRGSPGVLRLTPAVDLKVSLRHCPEPFTDRTCDGRALPVWAAGEHRVLGSGWFVVHEGFLRPQLRVPGPLRPAHYRERRPVAEPSGRCGPAGGARPCTGGGLELRVKAGWPHWPRGRPSRPGGRGDHHGGDASGGGRLG